MSLRRPAVPTVPSSIALPPLFRARPSRHSTHSTRDRVRYSHHPDISVDECPKCVPLYQMLCVENSSCYLICIIHRRVSTPVRAPRKGV